MANYVRIAFDVFTVYLNLPVYPKGVIVLLTKSGTVSFLYKQRDPYPSYRAKKQNDMRTGFKYRNKIMESKNLRNFNFSFIYIMANAVF